MKKVVDYLFIQQLKELPFVDEIWLFGSRARNDNQERSDIDLAIICPEASEKDWQKVMKIIEEADTLLKIDCVRFDELGNHETLKKNILKYKKVIYHKNRDIQ